jgi:hypothetical protein
MDLEAMHRVHDGAASSIANATKSERVLMAGDLARTAVRLAAAGRPLGVLSWSYGVDELQTVLEQHLMRFVSAGRRQVAGELARQVAANAGGAKAPGKPAALTLASRRRRTRRTPGTTTTPAGAVAVKSVAIAAGVLATMREAAVKAITGPAAASLTAPALEKTILAASDDGLLRLAASVSDLVSVGRSAEAAANASQIEDAVVSALLDGNTCGACEELDGYTTTDLTEAADLTPVPDCEGGDRCRCCCVYEIAQ